MALFISPPFGNYFFLPYTTPIRGSFTLEPRTGLLGQIFKTLRYSWEQKGWINKIGLRNKGIDYAIKTYKKGQIISVAILKEDEIDQFLEKIPEDMDIELNISCPNLDKHLVSNNLDKFLNDKRDWCIVKLSINDEVDDLYDAGFRQFHCCNTIPVKNGGLSGISLIPYVSEKIKNIKEKYPDTTVIAGGGIRDMDTMKMYKKCGADHYSVSSVMFNPFKFTKLYLDYVFDK